MKIYIPLDVFNRDDIKALYTSLGPKIVKDISLQIDRYYDLCQTIDISKEFKHNKYIQQKYFNRKLDKGSAPLYISKSNRVHISKLHNGSKYLKLLEIHTNSATTPEQITAAYRIISVSFWPDFTAHNILPWVDKHYKTLIDAGMKISRIPFISNINHYGSLLSLGKFIANTGNAYTYCIWEGTAAELQRDLTTVKLRVNQECCLFEQEDKNIEEFMKSIDKQLSMIKIRLNDQKPSVPSLCNNEQKIVPISEKPLTVTISKQPDYTPETIIAKLGRKEAAALAQAILNKLLE
jgi:hypothetical protein